MESDEITVNLRSFFEVLKKEIRVILISPFLFSIFGVLYIMNIPKEYTAVGKIMPEVAHKPANNTGGLFELVKKYGGNIDLYNTEITRPELYGEIIKTKIFYDLLSAKNLETGDGKKENLKNYYERNLKLFQSIATKPVTEFKLKEHTYYQNMQKRIVILVDKKTNLVQVSVKMPEPVIASQAANFAVNYLIDYITKYRTEKARQELLFVENLLKKDTLTNNALSEEIRKSLLATAVQMKLKIQEDTPVLQVLEYARVPAVSSETSSFKIISLCIFLGLLAGVIIAVCRNGNLRLIFNFG